MVGFDNSDDIQLADGCSSQYLLYIDAFYRSINTTSAIRKRSAYIY